MERIITNRKDQPTCHFSSSAEAILASQQGYFPDSNGFGSICFYIFKGDDYTLAFPINSPSGAQGEAGHEIEEDHQLIIGEIGVFSKIGLLHQRTVQSLIQRSSREILLFSGW